MKKYGLFALSMVLALMIMTTIALANTTKAPTNEEATLYANDLAVNSANTGAAAVPMTNASKSATSVAIAKNTTGHSASMTTTTSKTAESEGSYAVDIVLSVAQNSGEEGLAKNSAKNVESANAPTCMVNKKAPEVNMATMVYGSQEGFIGHRSGVMHLSPIDKGAMKQMLQQKKMKAPTKTMKTTMTMMNGVAGATLGCVSSTA